MPFTMLWDKYFEVFIKMRLNPELGIDASALDRFSVDEFAGAARRLQDEGLSNTFHAPFIDLSPGSTDPKIREITRNRFEQVIELIPLFRPKTVVCHIGYEWKRYGYLGEEWIEKSLETWLWFAESINQAGSRMMLENVYEHDPEDILAFFERLQEFKVGFCLDTGHQSAFSRSSLDRWLDSMGSYIGQVHLHDNHGERDEHLALGQGDINFRSFFRRLKKICKEPPFVTIEPHQEADLQPSLDYLEEAWPW